jgi:anti-anti-sigma factor
MVSRPFCSHPEAEVDEAVTVVHFTGGKVLLNEESCERVRDQLLALADEPSQTQLLLDFHNVQYLSGLALGILVDLHRKLLTAGRRLSLCNPIPQVYETLAVAGLNKLLHIRQAETRAEPALEDARRRSPVGVLVVDDDMAVRSVLAAGLRRQYFDVWLASQGHQAVALYRQHQGTIAVVLLDVLMPGMNGPQTLSALQKLCPAVRCCFMTADSGLYTEEVLLGLGALQLLRKPFALAEVIDTLAQLTSQRPQRRKDRWIELPLRGA